jgi:hypothetical protein
MQDLPKIIWMLWLQGWQHAPRIVQASRRSWEVHNPSWLIRCLDRRDFVDFIDNAELRAAIGDPDQPPEASSDRLRIALLAQHGGVWIDATVYCLRPLNDWLFGVLTSGFFAFDRPAPDRLVSSWFLAAEQDNYLVRRWAEITLSYWEGRAHRDHYFWFHHLFGREYEKNPDFRLISDNTVKISPAGPAYFVYPTIKLWDLATERDKQIIVEPGPPLLKLSHKLPEGAYPANSLAEYLCDRLGV